MGKEADMVNQTTRPEEKTMELIKRRQINNNIWLITVPAVCEICNNLIFMFPP